MMSFFPRSHCAPAADAGLVPLFRLLNDFDTYSREVSNASPSPAATRRPHHRRGARAQLTSFNPKFDVAETENTYELHGELPGLSRENVDIQFTDLQTIVISGRVERSYGSESDNNTATATAAEESNTTPTETNQAEAQPEKTRRNSHQATVEDDPEDQTWSSVSTPSETPRTEVAHPAVAETQVQQTQTQTQTKQQAQAQAEPQQRYWLWERSVGEFSRTFTFPGLVDHDGVTAALNNGILTVSVPKAKKPVARKIQISA